MSKKKFTPLEKAVAAAGEATAEVIVAGLKYNEAVENYNKLVKKIEEEAAEEVFHTFLERIEEALDIELTWEQAEKVVAIMLGFSQATQKL